MKTVLVLVLFGISLATSKPTIDDKTRQQFAFPHEIRSHSTIGPRIIGGKEAKSGQFPHQVGLLITTDMHTELCGGSLIREDTVLTAAHCTEKAIKATVVLGALNIDNNEDTQVKIDVTADNMVVHEDWSSSTLINDISLIKLGRSVNTNKYIQVVDLVSDSGTYEEQKGTASGWGLTEDGGSESSILRYVDLDIMSNDDCRATDPYQNVIKDTHMCTSGSGTLGTCQGDSGGALVVNGVQVGLVSFGYKYCEEGKPSVFTRLTKYTDWIKNNCFRKKTAQDADYLSIVSGPTGCWSSVGRIGGRQEINLQNPSCTTKVGTPMHELMHALGFLHEQNRYERDDYVSIVWKNIKKNHDNNFVKAKQEETDGFGVKYDYNSVMHYSKGAFSVNGQPTIVAKDSSKEMKMGQRDGFSKGDITKINNMYKCSNKGVGGTDTNNNNNNNSGNGNNSPGGWLSFLFNLVDK